MTRRVCKLADKNKRKNVNLKDYEDIIINTINSIAPNKNPKVEKDSFSTDVLTQGEAVKIGLALSAIPKFYKYGKMIVTFRLFDGKIVEEKKQVTNEATSQEITEEKEITTVKNKEDKHHGRYHRKKILNSPGGSTTIPTGKPKENQGILETIP